MKFYSGIRPYLILLLLLFITSGCAILPHNVPNTWGSAPLQKKPNHGFIVGNIRFHEPSGGKDFDTAPFTVSEWNFYGGLSLPRNTFSTFNSFDLKRADGYFAFELPAGDYKMDDFTLTHSPKDDILSHFTMKLPGPKMLLKVRPGRVVYIGHLYYEIRAKGKGPIRYLFSSDKSYPLTVALQISDESEKMRSQLKEMQIGDDFDFIRYLPSTEAQKI
jgi:hypothetical protein